MISSVCKHVLCESSDNEKQRLREVSIIGVANDAYDPAAKKALFEIINRCRQPGKTVTCVLPHLDNKDLEDDKLKVFNSG